MADLESIQPGYMGLLEADGVLCKCNSFNVNPSQAPLFFNHVYGLNDSGGGGDTSKSESIGDAQVQRRIIRPSPLQISGGFSLNPDHRNGAPLFDRARDGGYFDLTMNYGCSIAKTYTDCRINSYSISVTAGDKVNINCDVLAGNIETGGGSITPFTSKLITWDVCNVTGSGISGYIQGFNLNINNNAKYVFTNGPSTFGSGAMGAYDMRLGVQEVTGSILVYGDEKTKFIEKDYDQSTVTIKWSGFSASIKCVLEPAKIDGSTGLVVATIPFTGVDTALS